MGLGLNWMFVFARTSFLFSLTISSTLRSLIVLVLDFSLKSNPKGLGTVTPYFPFFAPYAFSWST